MIKLLKILILAICSLLPDSPFAHMADEMDLDRTFLQYLNWFVPLDIMGTMMLAWLNCLLVYAVFFIVWQIIKLVIMFKIKGALTIAKFLK
ncbi:MAG: hypothetical protein HFI57_08070 [Lachnospiraceae bacterium]|nr:hypothetical protein [Lachnospiraceae bacterium]